MRDGGIYADVAQGEKDRCTNCKSQIEKDVAKRIKAGIEKGLPDSVYNNRAWWQQFWKEFLGEESS
jgi:uncharacterized protein with PIN domain